MGTENKIQQCKCEDKFTKYHLTVCCKGMRNEDETLNDKYEMKQIQYKEIKKAISILSTFSGKQLNPDIPESFCEPIWVLIDFAQKYITKQTQ